MADILQLKRRVWIKVAITPEMRYDFKTKCKERGMDMSTFLKAKIAELLMEK